MAYKFSKRREQNRKIDHDSDRVDLGFIAAAFIVFGLLGLLTSLIYSVDVGPTFRQSLAANNVENKKEFGPIRVLKFNQAYEVIISADIPIQKWAFIEGEVLDGNKEYLFAFGKELWHEKGRDSDGYWVEKENSYSLKTTFPKPGNYYLRLNLQGDVKSDYTVIVRVTKKLGSSIPHFIFGIIALLIGIVLNEIRNRFFHRILMAVTDD